MTSRKRHCEAYLANEAVYQFTRLLLPSARDRNDNSYTEPIFTKKGQPFLIVLFEPPVGFEPTTY